MKKIIIVLLLCLIPSVALGLTYTVKKVADQGDPNIYGSAAFMAGVAGVKPATLRFQHNSNSTNTSYVFGTGVTFPNTLTIEVEPGALISIPVAAAHITIGKMADPGARQVFNDPNGMVTFGAGAVKEVYAEWWGDSDSDDTAYINYAIAAMPAGSILLCNASIYLIDVDTYIIPKANTTIKLSDNTTWQAMDTNSPNYSMIRSENISNWTLKGGILRGDRYTHLDVLGGGGHGVAIYGTSSDIKIEDVTITEFWGDGIYIGGSSAPNNIIMNNVKATHNRRNNMSITGGYNIRSQGCLYSDANGTAPQSGVDVEPNGSDIAKDITFSDCIFSNNSNRGLQIEVATAFNVLIDHCIAKDNLTQGFLIGVGAHDNIISNSISKNNGNVGINISSNNNSVLGCIVNDNQSQGIVIYEASNNIVSNNKIYNNYTNGINVYASDPNGTEASNNSILSNNIYNNSQLTDNTYYGIRIDTNADHNIIQNNLIRRGDGASQQKYGIGVVGYGCLENLVMNNDLYLSGKTSTYIDTGTSTITRIETDQTSITIEENAGAVTLTDMSVTASASIGTEESYTDKIDDIAITTKYAQSNGAGGIQNAAFKIHKPEIFVIGTTQNITDPNTQIAPTERLIVVDPNGDYTLKWFPTIINGISIGEIFSIMTYGTEGNYIILQDNDTLPGTNLQLGAATRTIAAGDMITLMWNNNYWCEVSYTNN